MPSKAELQAILKDEYDINKNITQSLSLEDCERWLHFLRQDASAKKLVDAFVRKNEELSKNNRQFGQRRRQAEDHAAKLKAQNEKLQKSIAVQESSHELLETSKLPPNQDYQDLKRDMEKLHMENQRLSQQLQGLTARNDELTEANSILKKDNKELKNVVDQIRLQLAKNTKELLQYEDSEIRKALVRVFRWTLG